MKYIVIDSKMRKFEKEYITSLGYNLIELFSNENLYDEISSHVDIHILKIEKEMFIEKTIKKYIDNKFDFNIGEDIIKNYPNDIKYNVCIMGKTAIHNFKYTEKSVKEYLTNKKYNMINVKQGYSKCSILVLNENACITGDHDIYKTLLNNNIDAIYVNDDNIKLLINDGTYSNMNGFIGGAMCVIQNTLVIFGDKNNLKDIKMIEDFAKKHNLEIKDFKGYDVVDYGGILEV